MPKVIDITLAKQERKLRSAARSKALSSQASDSRKNITKIKSTRYAGQSLSAERLRIKAAEKGVQLKPYDAELKETRSLIKGTSVSNAQMRSQAKQKLMMSQSRKATQAGKATRIAKSGLRLVGKLGKIAPALIPLNAISQAKEYEEQMFLGRRRNRRMLQERTFPEM